MGQGDSKEKKPEEQQPLQSDQNSQNSPRKSLGGINLNFLKSFAQNKVEEEQKRQDDLEQELAKQRLETVPNMEEIEVPEPEIDSDEIKSEEWPDPRPERVIQVYDDQCEEILTGLQKDLQVKQQGKLEIPLSMVPNLNHEDDYIRKQASEFICVMCKKYPVPEFTLGKDGVKRDSVKICQCNHCSGLACHSCWKKLCTKKDPTCPRCRFRVGVPQDLHLDPEKDQKVDKHLNILNQKLLLNFLFNQPIIHKCEIHEKEAFEKALNMYDSQVKDLKKQVFAQQNEESEIVKKLNNLKQFYAKQKEIREEKERKIKKEKEQKLQQKRDRLTALAFDKEEQYQLVEHYQKKIDEETEKRNKNRKELHEKLIQQKNNAIQDEIQAQKKAAQVRSEKRFAKIRRNKENKRTLREKSAKNLYEQEKYLQEKQAAENKIKALEQQILETEQNNALANRKVDSEHSEEKILEQNLDEIGSQHSEVLSPEESPDPLERQSAQSEQNEFNLDPLERQSALSEQKQQLESDGIEQEGGSLEEVSTDEEDREELLQADEQDKNLMADAIEKVTRQQDDKIHTLLIQEEEKWQDTHDTLLTQFEDAKDKLASFNDQYDELFQDIEAESIAMTEQDALEEEKKAQEAQMEEIEQKKMEDEKTERKEKMLGSIKTFIKGMIQSEEQYIRFKEMEEEDNKKLMQLVQLDLQVSKKRGIGYIKGQGPIKVNMNDDVVSKLEEDLEELDGPEEINLENAQTEEEKDFALKKNDMIKKIGDTLFSQEYTYIEYLNHITTDCVDSQVVEGGCPLEKCKLKHPVGLKDLRVHFNEECNKIDMECSNCKERFRRPFAGMHDCSDTYEARIRTEQEKLKEAQRIIQEYEKKIKEKEIEDQKNRLQQEKMTRHELELRDIELAAAKKQAQIAEQQALIAKQKAENAEKKRNEVVSRAVSVRSLHSNVQSEQGKIQLNGAIEGKHSSRPALSEAPVSPRKFGQYNTMNTSGSINIIDFNEPVRQNTQLTIQNKSSWDVSQPLIERKSKASIIEILSYLKEIELGIAKIDKYVEYSIKKYKNFQFNIKLFLKDESIAQTQYVEQFFVSNGQFQGYHFWGQLLGNQNQFRPHGFGVLIDLKSKVMQLGTFKLGKEYGQQRIIQSYPLKQRQITVFTCVNSKLNGPALIERATGKVESGNYVNDQQHGEWKHRYLNGKQETEFYIKGKVQTKEQLKVLLENVRSQASASQRGSSPLRGQSPQKRRSQLGQYPQTNLAAVSSPNSKRSEYSQAQLQRLRQQQSNSVIQQSGKKILIDRV